MVTFVTLEEIGCCDNGKGYNFKNYEFSGGKREYKIKELEVYKVELIN